MTDSGKKWSVRIVNLYFEKEVLVYERINHIHLEKYDNDETYLRMMAEMHPPAPPPPGQGSPAGGGSCSWWIHYPRLILD